jgi:hypothetical protein
MALRSILEVAGGSNGEVMLSYAEYRQFADACLGWAKNAKSDEERRTFLEMAATWEKLAEKVRSGLPPRTERRPAA